MLQKRNIRDDTRIFKLLHIIFMILQTFWNSAGAGYLLRIVPKRVRKEIFLKDNFFRFYGRFIYPALSQYMGGKYDPIMENVLQQWQSYTGKLFEDMIRELISDRIISEYPEIGSWWNRKGDEIDILAINREKREVLAIEIKNKELTRDEAKSILNYTSEKIKLITEVSGMNFKVGIAARKIEGNTSLEDEGSLVWELEDLL
ncbi:MAG: DUF234 domain-containing protein [Methanolobus sp.]